MEERPIDDSESGAGHVALGIVVPAFKGRFLARTLASLTEQTDPRFRVYVADDGSSEDLASIVAPFRDRLSLCYHRFADNCGAQSLTGHWRRSVALTREKWIWLLSDDDEAEPGCVEAFYRTVGEQRAAAVDLFRFNLKLIDENGAVYRMPEPHPAEESALQLAEALVSQKCREWRLSDHIFSRAVHDARGGFPDFPMALFSDYAAWIEFATPRGVRTIAGPHVRWRNHTGGVSSLFGQRHRRQLLEAIRLYSRWLHAYAARGEPPAATRLRALANAQVFYLVGLMNPPLHRAERAQLLADLSETRARPRWRDRWDLWRLLAKAYLRGKPVFRGLARWRYQRQLRWLAGQARPPH